MSIPDRRAVRARPWLKGSSRYEMRREAQEILPSVFVGPYQSSRDLARLQALGITHICCVSETREAYALQPRADERQR